MREISCGNTIGPIPANVTASPNAFARLVLKNVFTANGNDEEHKPKPLAVKKNLQS